jgi:diguanylate cyclase (GGDEF)-like protein
LTAYFFAIQFRYRRKPRLGALAGGFGYVSVLVFSQILVFPGALPAKTILLGGPQSAVWMWAFWHSGFPLFILAGQLLSTGESPDGASGPSQNLGLALIPGGPMIATFLVYLCITQGDTLPSLVSGMSLEGLRHSVFVPITIVATILALVTCVWTTRLRDLLSLWLAIALLASLADSILTLAATDRYDLGWYSGRILSIVALSIVFCVLIHEMSRLYDALANAHAELAQRVMRDGLTGAFNRRYFSEQFPREVLRAKRESTALSLLMIDVDHFKHYNDRYGHQQGDECLITVLEKIQDSIRRPADFTARYGGEEFAVLLPKTEFVGARLIAERIRSAIAGLELIADDGSVHAVTVSIGMDTLRPGASSLGPEEFLKRADLALYDAKHQGRNRVRSFEPHLT